MQVPLEGKKIELHCRGGDDWCLTATIEDVIPILGIGGLLFRVHSSEVTVDGDESFSAVKVNVNAVPLIYSIDGEPEFREDSILLPGGSFLLTDWCDYRGCYCIGFINL